MLDDKRSIGGAKDQFNRNYKHCSAASYCCCCCCRSSRVFHVIDSATLQATHMCTPAPYGTLAAPAALPTSSITLVDDAATFSSLFLLKTSTIKPTMLHGSSRSVAALSSKACRNTAWISLKRRHGMRLRPPMPQLMGPVIAWTFWCSSFSKRWRPPFPSGPAAIVIPMKRQNSWAHVSLISAFFACQSFGFSLSICPLSCSSCAFQLPGQSFMNNSKWEESDSRGSSCQLLLVLDACWSCVQQDQLDGVPRQVHLALSLKRFSRHVVLCLFQQNGATDALLFQPICRQNPQPIWLIVNSQQLLWCEHFFSSVFKFDIPCVPFCICCSFGNDANVPRLFLGFDGVSLCERCHCRKVTRWKFCVFAHWMSRVWCPVSRLSAHRFNQHGATSCVVLWWEDHFALWHLIICTCQQMMQPLRKDDSWVLTMMWVKISIEDSCATHVVTHSVFVPETIFGTDKKRSNHGYAGAQHLIGIVPNPFGRCQCTLWTSLSPSQSCWHSVRLKSVTKRQQLTTGWLRTETRHWTNEQQLSAQNIALQAKWHVCCCSEPQTLKWQKTKESWMKRALKLNQHLTSLVTKSFWSFACWPHF